ncbi:hypothetical protein B4923_00810 [Brenneria roseae subsp. americana]|uniref:Uncharacterized protein n=1 Tax=Brenneria roseae subsp. americana TaxID=1508507 RepID=A0A2U1U1Z1_9GAMM|nr:hypothetical protein [Brenneria roseae]PWC15689.1 hypothetical protein B4923_00810 [Brenneria roseae subsp. americana]
MKKHPNKHIQAAIEYALAQGWRFHPSNGHAFGRLICGTQNHHDHMMSIWSTPSNPENHAKQICRKVDSCLAILKKN